MHNIFAEDDKTVIIAMDHGVSLDVLPGLSNPGEIIREVKAGGADAVLTSYGIARKFNKELSSLGLIVRADGGNSELSNKPGGKILYDVEDCLKLGADAIACMGFPGAENEEITLQNVSYLAARGEEWGVPLLAEMLPGGFSEKIPNSMENIKMATRLGGELGAHIIKTDYPDQPEKFEKVTEGSLAPVVILGGSKSDNKKDLLKGISRALEAGVNGVAIGRNVWKSRSPSSMTKAIVDVVHNEVNPEKAWSKNLKDVF